MKKEQTTLARQTPTKKSVKVGNSLSELQDFVLSIIDLHKDKQVEIHLHFVTQSNKNGINICGDYNSVMKGGLR